MSSPLYEVNIDFDGAKAAWRENKNVLPNGCYTYKKLYRCHGKTKSGKRCQKRSAFEGDCIIHEMQNLVKEASDKKYTTNNTNGYNKRQLRELKKLDALPIDDIQNLVKEASDKKNENNTSDYNRRQLRELKKLDALPY